MRMGFLILSLNVTRETGTNAGRVNSRLPRAKENRCDVCSISIEHNLADISSSREVSVQPTADVEP